MSSTAWHFGSCLFSSMFDSVTCTHARNFGFGRMGCYKNHPEERKSHWLYDKGLDYSKNKNTKKSRWLCRLLFQHCGHKHACDEKLVHLEDLENIKCEAAGILFVLQSLSCPVLPL
ncbi:hypothetical protein Dimus_002757 [Dionaea muscipula]